ncbi:hypothetical protein Q6288_28925, partial [Klebsiella quasipneumoniae]
YAAGEVLIALMVAILYLELQ